MLEKTFFALQIACLLALFFFDSFRDFFGIDLIPFWILISANYIVGTYYFFETRPYSRWEKRIIASLILGFYFSIILVFWDKPVLMTTMILSLSFISSYLAFEFKLIRRIVRKFEKTQLQ